MSSRLGEKLRDLGFRLGDLISRQSRTTTELNIGVKQLNRSIQAISKEKIGSEIQVLPEYRLAKKLVEEKCPVVFVTGGAGFIGAIILVKLPSIPLDGVKMSKQSIY